MTEPNHFQRDIDHWDRTGKCLRHFALDTPPLFCEQCGKDWKAVIDGREGRKRRRGGVVSILSCMGCGQQADEFVTGCLEHPHDGLCRRCVDAIRAEPVVVRVHHGDPDEYARAYNEGYKDGTAPSSKNAGREEGIPGGLLDQARREGRM